MDKKQKFHNDPAKFFLYQDRLLSANERKSAMDFSATVLDMQSCGVCGNAYDLALRAPRILVHCGHTVCTSCLYLFFKDQRIRCPLCSKVIKRLRVVEVLPLNHQIFNVLSNRLQEHEIDPINLALRLPDEINRELTEKEEVDVPLCELHGDRYKHFACVQHSVLLCRVCVTESTHPCPAHLLDLYLLRPEVVKLLLIKLAKENHLS